MIHLFSLRDVKPFGIKVKTPELSFPGVPQPHAHPWAFMGWARPVALAGLNRGLLSDFGIFQAPGWRVFGRKSRQTDLVSI